MKKNLIRLLSAAMFMVAVTSVGFAQQKNLRTLDDSASYAIGYNYAKAQLLPAIENMRAMGYPLNVDLMLKAIQDMVNGNNGSMTDDQCQAVLVEYQQRYVAAKDQENLDRGRAWLAENGKKEGVITTKSGLQYQILTPGTGAKPDGDDEVTVNYKGMLTDGSTFDESKSGPVSFPVNGVIRGWTEALQMMKAGAKWRLFIPSELAYGANGAGGKIGPNEVLIFDVDLISVQPK